jgi:hypothetical protein
MFAVREKLCFAPMAPAESYRSSGARTGLPGPRSRLGLLGPRGGVRWRRGRQLVRLGRSSCLVPAASGHGHHRLVASSTASCRGDSSRGAGSRKLRGRARVRDDDDGAGVCGDPLMRVQNSVRRRWARCAGVARASRRYISSLARGPRPVHHARSPKPPFPPRASFLDVAHPRSRSPPSVSVRRPAERR